MTAMFDIRFKLAKHKEGAVYLWAIIDTHNEDRVVFTQRGTNPIKPPEMLMKRIGQLNTKHMMG